ncbi:MAG: hypothetical protein AAAC47_07490 [Pararhizobium sp.]
MNDLEKQAAELGIKVDKRWSEKRLQEEIDGALDAPSKPEQPKEEAVMETVKLFPVKLIKNYRPAGEFKIIDADGQRDPTDEETFKVSAGTAIALPVKEAQVAVEKKIAERNDPIR